jgi:hypothetical protein
MNFALYLAAGATGRLIRFGMLVSLSKIVFALFRGR